MFKYKCFIRKNNEFLRETLKKLGYAEINPNDKDVIISTNDGHGLSYYTTIDERSIENLGSMYIDCGKSETLFLAVSAITDEHDKFQFFTTLAKQQWINQAIYVPERSLVLCLVSDWNFGKNPLFDSFNVPARKSTIEELIKNFGTKESDENYYSGITAWEKTEMDFEKYQLSEKEKKMLEELNKKVNEDYIVSYEYTKHVKNS